MPEIIDSHRIRFDEVYAIDDVTFSYLVGYYAKNIKVDDRVVYCKTCRPDSVTQFESYNWNLTQMEVLSRKNRFMRIHHIPVFDQGMLRPIRFGLKGRNWKQLDAFFSIAKQYGFSRLFILYYIGKQSARCRIDKFLSKI